MIKTVLNAHTMLLIPSSVVPIQLVINHLRKRRLAGIYFWNPEFITYKRTTVHVRTAMPYFRLTRVMSPRKNHCLASMPQNCHTTVL